MTKEEYRKNRIADLGGTYMAHTTSKTEWDKCIAMECGELPVPDRNRNGFTAILMLLSCQFSAEEIDAALEVLYPDLKNTGRAQRMAQIFSNGKCRNVEIVRQGGILGMKWGRHRFFTQSDQWQGDEHTV